MRLPSLCVAAAALLSPVACSSGNFQLATDPAAADAAGTGADGAGGNVTDAGGGNVDVPPPPECLNPPPPAACLTPASGHAPLWSTTPGTPLEPRLSDEEPLAFEMNVLPRARLDKFEVPMAIEGTGCTGAVTVRVMVETCPGVFVELRRLDRPASDMRASSNYWWFNPDGSDLPWMKIDTRYRFELTTTSENCRFRVAALPSGQTREAGARFAWFQKKADTWTKLSGEVVAVPWIARCNG